MCSALRWISEGSSQHCPGGPGVTPDPTVAGWLEEGALHQGIVDRPEGLCLRVFYSEEAHE